MRLRLIFAESWRSLAANASTTVAATVTVLISMFLLGLCIALGSWVNAWKDHIKADLVVKVYFADTAGAKQWNSVAKFVQRDGRVKKIDFVDKQQALAIMEKKYPELTSDLAYNPLPNSLEVTPKQGNDTVALGTRIQKAHPVGVDKVNWGGQKAKRIVSIGKAIGYVFVAALLVLMAASTLLIANTIRLSIFSRRREVEVMKLVGATNWFVRGPFMLEGLICGFVGSIAAILMLMLGKEIALPAILGHISDSSDVHALSFPLTALALLVAGLLIGAAGSGLTIRRFLRV